MKTSRSFAVFGAVVIAFLAGTLTQKYGVVKMRNTKYIKTVEPLLLNAGGEHTYLYMLPPNTPMYKDYSFPEGHTRYIIYVNIKDKFSSEQIESDKPDLIDPIWAFPVEKEEVSKLMAATPISKEDLIRILKAREVTREDLAQIVREWEK